MALVVSLTSTAEAQRGASGGATAHDFGRVLQGDVVTHEFRILNPQAAGRAKVVRVDLNVPGMTARFKPDVGPGEFVTVRISWNTAQQEGAVTAEGLLRWADPKRPPVMLTLRGHVLPPVELQPMGAVFFSVFADEAAERVVQIVNHESKPLTVHRVEARGSHFEATVTEVQRGRRFDLRVNVRSGLPPGRFREELIIFTDSPRRPAITMPVNVLVKADVYANPEVVDFGDVDAAAVERKPALRPLLTQTIIVRRRQGPFEITNASTNVPGLGLEVSPGSAPAHRIDVSFLPGQLARRSLDGQIRLTTSDPRFPVIVIPVRGRVR